MGLDEALVGGDRVGEALLDAVLEAQQAAERGVVALGGVLAGGEGEAVGVDRAAAGLAVQRAAHDARHVVGLLADLRHRGGLPQVAAAQRADGEEGERVGQGAEDATVVGGVDAEAGRAGPDQARLGQAGEQRVGRDGADRAGAVDHRRDAQGRPVVEGDVEGGPVGAYGGEGAAVAHEPALRCDRVEASRGGRRHPVPVHVPRAGVLGDEASLVGLRQPSPQLGGDGTEPVDRGAPVAGARDGLLHVCGQGRAEGVEVLGAGDAGRRRHRGRRGQHVGQRHRVGARDHVDGAVRPVGADREVDHGQARAQHQHVADLGDRLRPRVGDQAGVGRELGRGPPGAGSAAGREDDRAGLEPLAVGELDDEPVAGAADVGDLGVAPYEPGVAGELGRGGQQALDVAPERRARREVVRLELRVVVVAQPAEEVLGVAGERAHARGRDVEEVALVRRGVGLAAAGARRRVDQLDTEARGERRHQVGGHQGAAGTGSHHDDPTVTLVRLHASSSFSPPSYCTNGISEVRHGRVGERRGA